MAFLEGIIYYSGVDLYSIKNINGEKNKNKTIEKCVYTTEINSMQLFICKL